MGYHMQVGCIKYLLQIGTYLPGRSTQEGLGDHLVSAVGDRTYSTRHVCIRAVT